MPVLTPPDPLSVTVYAGLFVGVTLATMHRPAYGICALILVQPFAFYSDLAGTTITLPKTALIAVVLGLFTYPHAFAPLAAGVPRRIALAGAIVLAATAFSYFAAIHHVAVLRESLKILEYTAIFAAVVAAYRLDPDRRSIRAVALAVAIAVALLALVQEAFGAPSAFLLNGHPTPRIAGPLEGPNQLAGYFDVALPLVLAFSIDEPSALAYAALALGVFADVLTFSRGGALGVAAGVAAVAITMRRNLRTNAISVAMGLGAGVIVAATWGVLAHAIGLARFWDIGESVRAGGVATRSQLWRFAIDLWKRHPIFGLGAGNFELEISLTGARGVKTHANSLYLQSLVEGGIPLFAATLWLVYTSIAAFARRRLSSPFIAGAFGASIALALHQVVDLLTFYPKIGGWWWIVLALGAACA